MNPQGNRIKLMEILFEKYGFQAFYPGCQAVLALYGNGLLTGMVLECGDSVTHALPVFEGFLVSKAIKRMNFAGSDITELLIKLLGRRGYQFNRTADYDTVRQIKEKFCYVAADLALENKLAKETIALEKTYTLPDKRELTIGSERFEASEGLFQPALVEKEGDGLAEIAYGCIQSCDIDIRADLYKNIYLSGGTSMFPGLPTRLEIEITNHFVSHGLKGDRSKLATSKWQLDIHDPPRRKNMVFLGGAIFGEIASPAAECWLTAADYKEIGAKSLLAKHGL
jgi:actin-related protein 2